MTTYKYQVEITNKVASNLPKQIADLKDAQNSAAITFEKIHDFLSVEFVRNMEKTIADKLNLEKIEVKMDIDIDRVIDMLDEIRSALVVNMGINERNIAEIQKAFTTFLEKDKEDEPGFIENAISELYKQYQDDFNNNLLQRKNELINEFMKVVPTISDEINKGKFIQQDIKTNEFSFTDRITAGEIIKRSDIQKAVTNMWTSEITKIVEETFPTDFNPFEDQEHREQNIRNKMDELRGAAKELDEYLKEVEDEDKGHYVKVQEKIRRLTEQKENLESELEMMIKSVRDALIDQFKENITSSDILEEGSKITEFIQVLFQQTMEDSLSTIMEHAQDFKSVVLYRPTTIFKREMKKRTTESNIDLTGIEQEEEYRKITSAMEQGITRHLKKFYNEIAPDIINNEDIENTSVGMGNAFSKYLEDTEFAEISLQLGNILAKSLHQQWRDFESEFDKVMKISSIEDIYPMIKFQRNLRQNFFDLLKSEDNSDILEMLNTDMASMFSEEGIETASVEDSDFEGLFDLQNSMLEAIFEQVDNNEKNILAAIENSVNSLSGKLEMTERNIMGAIETEEQRNIREVREMTSIPSTPSNMREI